MRGLLANAPLASSFKGTVTQRLLADLFKMLPRGPVATKSAWHVRRGL